MEQEKTLIKKISIAERFQTENGGSEIYINEMYLAIVRQKSRFLFRKTVHSKGNAGENSCSLPVKAGGNIEKMCRQRRQERKRGIL